jgi:putative oxidoreductase
MQQLRTLACQAQGLLDRTRSIDFLAPLTLRLYLAPIFWVSGVEKYNNFDSIVAWFGNPDWGLGLPFPTLMAFLATSAELVGAVALLVGVGVRWISIPLMVTMIVAAASVHWHNGWQAIADTQSVFASPHLGPIQFENASGAAERLDRAISILQEHGHYSWLTEEGGFAILNNGIEFAATYFIMLLALFFIGAGRYASVDYWLGRGLCGSTAR